MILINNIKVSKLSVGYPYSNYFHTSYFSNLKKYSNVNYNPGNFFYRDITYSKNFGDFLKDNIPKIKFWTKSYRFFL